MIQQRKNRPAILSLSLLFLTACLVAVVSSDSGEEDDFRWEDAAREVADLPYKQKFFDSLHAAYNVARLDKPLRIAPENDFFRGETLVYDVGWGVFKAGSVILTTEPDTAKKIIRICGKALSNSFVSTFYRMRDYVISTVDASGLYPLFFEQHLREGKKYKSDGWILYDHVRGKVYVKERHLKTLDAPAFVNDYLSVLYNVRTMKFKPGDAFSLPLYVDNKIHTIRFFCRERKRQKVDSLAISCLCLEPRVEDDKGTFNKKNKLEVWLSDDTLKRPILIKSKIKIGSVPAGAGPEAHCGERGQ